MGIYLLIYFVWSTYVTCRLSDILDFSQENNAFNLNTPIPIKIIYKYCIFDLKTDFVIV